MLNNTRARVTAAVTVLALMLVPGVASAQTMETAINSAISDGQSTVLGVLSGNVGLILAVSVAFVLLAFGKRIVRSLKG
jgi:threonine/homoserine/homoserine lactone efflux protein